MTASTSAELSHRVLAIRHGEYGGLGTFAQVCHRLGVAHDYLDPGQGQVLEGALQTYSHVVVLGGAMGAYEVERYPHLRLEYDLIEEALDLRIPLLGICLGSQMLAQVLGAQVRRGSHGPEVGWHPVSITPAAGRDPLFQGFPQHLQAFQWHFDTFDLPQGCTLLAHSDHYLQAFTDNRQAWGLQFHLEVTPKIVDHWVQETRDLGNPDRFDLDRILAAGPQYFPDFETLAEGLMTAFLQRSTPAWDQRGD